MSEPSAKTCRHGVAHDGICFSCSQLDLHKVQAVAQEPAKVAEPVEEIKSKALSVYARRFPVTQADADRGYVEIDVYRIQVQFNMTDPCLLHAHKKIMCPGVRSGGKSVEKDIKEARYSLERWCQMRDEERK